LRIHTRIQATKNKQINQLKNRTLEDPLCPTNILNSNQPVTSLFYQLISGATNLRNSTDQQSNH